MKSKLSKLKALAVKSQERTRTERAEAESRRESRRRPVEPDVPKPQFRLSDRDVNSSDVYRWFERGLRELRGTGWVMSRWTVKERKLAKMLLDDYGAELVEKAVDYFCSSWNEQVRRSRGRIVGDPTVNLLWAMRAQVFPVVQSPGTVGVAPKDTDEYNPGTDDGSGIGW